jgi:sterol desaturase/sphingolipid hydroxylase (fatty acid hydroxylase superfamily)
LVKVSHSRRAFLTGTVCTGGVRRHLTGLTFAVALVFALLTRGTAVFGIALLFVLFVPLEKLFALRRQKTFRPGLLTDLTHVLVNNVLTTIAVIVLVIAAAIPFFWVRRMNLVRGLPAWTAIVLAATVVAVANYWGHRLTHQVPVLWRFHSVHHSIEQMDWVASGRLHPLDQAFTQAITVFPLVLLGYGAGVFGGVAVFITLLALFQHANVRLRFPGVRWVINTPEWHHWHHAIDEQARDKNFGLPVVDKLFGTAYLPKGERPHGFGTRAPVPADGYLRHLAYPFSPAAKVEVA